ncbi:hypothetical protein LCGC14_0743120 [marine sediment metagenome]|uniref:Uncharacterized protein n=1 Tax=marine sediment metagenome TaxID=412755 RepID=A0A0F9QR55_9ZZZZ
MKKLKSLSELREHLRKGVSQGYIDTMHTYSHDNSIMTGWAELRFVVVGSLERGVRCCARSNKEDDETEITLIRKPPEPPGGLTQKNWDEVIPKCAAWLEKKGLYIDRKVITDETPIFLNMM